MDFQRWLREAAGELSESESPKRDAEILLEHVTGKARTYLLAFGETELTAEQEARLAALLVRRKTGEPVAHLVGEREFWSLPLYVSAATLIPRPDTEVLVEQGLVAIARKTAPRLVDLGTGSGIVAVTLALARPDAEVSAVDISPAALDVARSNAARLGATVRFLAGDWFAPLAGERFDLIVSNPPYVAAGDPHLTRDGLPFEPQGALTDGVSGGDGMACIAHLVAHAVAHLTPGGALRIEHGYDQAVKTRTLLLAAGFAEVDSWRDGAGIERVSGGRWPAPA